MRARVIGIIAILFFYTLIIGGILWGVPRLEGYAFKWYEGIAFLAVFYGLGYAMAQCIFRSMKWVLKIKKEEEG